ncbi:MAG: hypothetical protein LBC99_06625 [Spirochaetota bacterium]|jgi:prophage tail gpP-like protein|nr:hypothetical protein [Spirochaetota bacterium]
MPKAHKVAQGDTLNAIAIRYTGSAGAVPSIVAANPQLQGRKQSLEGWPVIFPDDTLIMPEDQTAAAPAPAAAMNPVVVGGGEQDCSIVINGKKFTGFISYSLKLQYDSLDTFSFTAPYDPNIEALRELAQPFAFALCEVFYNDALVFRGTLLTPDPELANTTSEITLQGYPLCGVLNDCMTPPTRYPLQCMGLNLKGIADAACDSYSIPVVFDGEIGPPFTEVSLEATDNVLDFLVKLAKQRKLLCTNTSKGELLFFSPKEEEVFASFTEGRYPLLSVKPKFNAQNFYSHITGLAKTEVENLSLAWVFENSYLINKGVLRHHTVNIDSAESQSDLENAVIAYAGRMLSDCVSFTLECESHVNEKNEVFKKGMRVSVYAPSAMIARETVFIAKEVELQCTTEGKTAVLTLVLPGSYTGEIPKEFPWE